MKIGVPKEIKNQEYRVALLPSGVAKLIAHGHSLFIEKNAGNGSGFADQEYSEAGATMVDNAQEVFAQAQLIIKVKEPQHNECRMLRHGQILFTYLHLAADIQQTQALINSGAICIAYETINDAQGHLPLLMPMSEIAGRMSIQAGANALQKSNGGAGLLLAGVPGVAPANVVILGGGIVGRNAAQMALGLGANVTILDKKIDILRQIDTHFSGRINTVYSSKESLNHYVLQADLVIGAVLIPGAVAPKLVSRELIKRMKKGSAVVDVAIDQGGCFATSHATTHDKPMYLVDEIVHYCVTNMPGAVARTATQALSNATLPYIIKLADQGYKKALLDDKHLRNGLNICAGKVVLQEIAKAHQLAYVPALQVL